MVMRTCNGTDQNLTRQVPFGSYDAATMRESVPWRFTARPAHMVICCQCGMRFDDVDRMTTYPHELLGQAVLWP